MKHKKEFSFQTRRNFVLLILITILVIIISLITPQFFTVKNLLNILNNNSIMGVLAIGMTIALSTGSIDVSIGAQFAMVTIAVSKFIIFLDGIGIQSVIIVLIGGMLIGICIGALNGLVIASIKLPAVIVTFGTLSMMRGLLFFVTNGSWITNLPKWYTSIASHRIIGIHLSTYLWMISMGIIFCFFRYTFWGKTILAYGNNREGAIRIGIHPDRMYLLAFSLYGSLIGIAGCLSVAQLGSAQPAAGGGYEMLLVAAAIIGGNKITGGLANVLGTCLGVITIGLINNAMIFMQVPLYYQHFATGLLILLSILSSSGNLRQARSH